MKPGALTSDSPSSSNLGFAWNHPMWWWSWLMLGVTLGANMVPAMAGKEKSLSRSVKKQKGVTPSTHNVCRF